MNLNDQLIINLRKLKKEIFSIKNNESECGCKARILVVDDNEFNIIPVNHLIKEYFAIEIE